MLNFQYNKADSFYNVSPEVIYAMQSLAQQLVVPAPPMQPTSQSDPTQSLQNPNPDVYGGSQ